MAGQKPKILLLGQIDHAHDTWASLDSIGETITPKASSRSEFIAEAKSGAFDGAVAAYRTFGSYDVTGRIDGELLDALPKSLKFLSHNGAGYDQVDIAACTAHDVRVSNCPTAVDDSTADIGIFLMLGALRNFSGSIHALRRGFWRTSPPPVLGHDPQGKVLGILGMGGIGRNMAKKARVFGMTIKYYNRTKLSPEMEEGAEYVSFETLMKESDVLSLNLPLNAHTRHTIGAPQFAMMKDGVVIVNTARGAVMDEAALVDALASGKVYSAGLDVFEEEPKVHPGLIANENVLLVPHMGTYSIETQKKMEEWTIGNVRSALEKGMLMSIVPEQKSLQ